MNVLLQRLLRRPSGGVHSEDQHEGAAPTARADPADPA
jgi:hypothetical protein